MVSKNSKFGVKFLSDILYSQAQLKLQKLQHVHKAKLDC